MNAPLYLYNVTFANGREIIIAAVNFDAASDCAKDELLKRTHPSDQDLVRKSPKVSVTQIFTNVLFAVAPTPELPSEVKQ